MIRICSDSTCDLSAELVERYGITILPLHVLLGEDERLDGVNITPEEIFAWADAHKATPKTSAVAFEDVQAVFNSLLEPGDEIIAFSIASGMSSSNNVLRMAAEESDAPDRVSVIDSANLSTGIGLLVVEAAVWAQEGRTREEITAHITELIPKVRASFVVDTLTYLYRGGRCSGLSALVGSALKLHPKIVVKDGAMGAEKKYRGKMSQVYTAYAKDLEMQMRHARKNRVFITHTCLDRKGPDEVRAYLESLHIFDEILETFAGSVVTSHCGPGTLGVLFISE